MNEPLIAQLHSVYCTESRYPLELTMQRKFTWDEFAARFNADDLALVLKNLRREVREGRRMSTCMGFRKLIGDTENFEELLAQYRAQLRRPQYAAGKAAVLRATGRPSQPEQEPTSFATNVERKRLSDMLAAFRKKLDDDTPEPNPAESNQPVIRGSQPGANRTVGGH